MYTHTRSTLTPTGPLRNSPKSSMPQRMPTSGKACTTSHVAKPAAMPPRNCNVLPKPQTTPVANAKPRLLPSFTYAPKSVGFGPPDMRATPVTWAQNQKLKAKKKFAVHPVKCTVPSGSQWKWSFTPILNNGEKKPNATPPDEATSKPFTTLLDCRVARFSTACSTTSASVSPVMSAKLASVASSLPLDTLSVSDADSTSSSSPSDAGPAESCCALRSARLTAMPLGCSRFIRRKYPLYLTSASEESTMARRKKNMPEKSKVASLFSGLRE
mmetsp:Transcript_73733/g.225492  ORF Transcript_73733/g.225492 Transcript_73733/m.225492 type:complete len:271 (+) Transcript_73733:167-979(+)